MKKYLFILAFGALFMCSCKNHTPENEIYIEKTGRLHKIDFEGHRYIIMGNPNTYRGGICHDENCYCKTDTVK